MEPRSGNVNFKKFIIYKQGVNLIFIVDNSSDFYAHIKHLRVFPRKLFV